MVSSLLEPPAVHPAERRRRAAAAPPSDIHDVALRPLGGGGGRALIVTAREETFLDALFEDLKADDWRDRLAPRRSVRRGAGGVLELGLPIHRHFQVVLLEAVCRTPGFPRIDPRKLVSNGLVIRRMERAGGLRGWMKAGGKSLGWIDVAPAIAALAEPDPDPALRRPDTATPAGQLAALLAARRGGGKPAAEDVVPLFVAPPEVCEARRRTILYGLVPVSSSDVADTAEIPDFNDLAADDNAAVFAHFSEYLKPRPKLAMPKAGAALDPQWHVLKQADDAEGGRLNAFGLFLQQLRIELGAFEGGAAGKALLAELRQLVLPLARDGKGRVTRSADAASFTEAAAGILVAGEPNASGLTMPLEWPSIDPAAGARLTGLARSCLTARFRQLIAETPKFDRDEARYTVRAFVRVAGHAHCPAKLVWSDYSEPFRILPWWDSDAPAARVSLPALGKLKNVKPNITFEMPPGLANLLRGDPKKISDGEADPPSDIGIGWLCSFSLPFITICAFISLNIFIGLFDLFLFWMAYLKICIPYPKPK